MVELLCKKLAIVVVAFAAGVLLSDLGAQAQSTAAPAPAAPNPGAGQSVPAVSPDGSSAAKSAPAAPVTVLENTLIRVITNQPINSKRDKHGTPLLFTVNEDVTVDGVLAIPRGAIAHGTVTESKKAGRLTGSPELTLQLDSLELAGRSYPLYTYQFKVKGTSKTRPTETKALQGAVVGAIVGGLAGSPSAKAASTDTGRAASMGTGAVLGAGVGTMVSAATPGPAAWIPVEAQVDFYLAAPITVPPVSAKEAARLAQGLRPGGPSLYVRDDVH
jgi:hypothetical protein